MKSYYPSVIALLLATSSVSADSPDPATQIVLSHAVQSDPRDGYVAGSCDATPANRPIINTQDLTQSDPWDLGACNNACFETDLKVSSSVITDPPTWTLYLGGEYLITHLEILTDFFSEQGNKPKQINYDYTPGDAIPSPDQQISGTLAAKTWIMTEIDYQPIKITSLTLVARVVQDPVSYDYSSSMTFCGIKVYGTKSAKEQEIDAEKAKVATCEGEKTTLQGEKTTLQGEKTTLQTEKTAVEKTRDSYINPEDDCGGFKLFGRKWCKIPEKKE